MWGVFYRLFHVIHPKRPIGQVWFSLYRWGDCGSGKLKSLSLTAKWKSQEVNVAIHTTALWPGILGWFSGSIKAPYFACFCPQPLSVKAMFLKRAASGIPYVPWTQILLLSQKQKQRGMGNLTLLCRPSTNFFRSEEESTISRRPAQPDCPCRPAWLLRAGDTESRRQQ